MNRTALIVAVVALVLIVVGWLIFRGTEEPAPPPPPPVATEPGPAQELPPTPSLPTSEPEPVEVPEAPPPLPPVAESDEFVRERLEPMGLPEEWLEVGDYVPRLAVLAENASRGQIPRRQLQFLTLPEPFKAIQQDDTMYVDPAGYDRYDAYVTQLESIDVEQLAGLLRTIEPLLGDALREIGVTAAPDNVLQTAITEVLDTPEPGPGPIALERVSLVYQFADPKLEALPPVQKQLLRMGPENAQRVKAYLRELAAALGLNV